MSFSFFIINLTFLWLQPTLLPFMPWIDDWFAKVHYPLTTERSMLIKKNHEHTHLPEPLPYFHISGVKWKGGSQDRVPFKVFLIAESNTFSTNETVSLSGITICHNMPALVQVVGGTFSSLNPCPLLPFPIFFCPESTRAFIQAQKYSPTWPWNSLHHNLKSLGHESCFFLSNKVLCKWHRNG